jgi:hypothetical protein
MRKQKVKYKSAEHKRQAMMLAESWEKLKRKYDVKPETKNDRFEVYVPPKSDVLRRHTQHYPSLNSGLGAATKPVNSTKVYTGTKMIGIGTLHKSNSVPVFSDEEAKDISRMRRG